MILNRELMHNKRRINLDKKIRKLTALAHYRAMGGLLSRVNKHLVENLCQEVLDEGKNPDERGIR